MSLQCAKDHNVISSDWKNLEAQVVVRTRRAIDFDSMSRSFGFQ